MNVARLLLPAAGNQPGAREQSDGAAWTFKHQSLVCERFGKKKKSV